MPSLSRIEIFLEVAKYKSFSSASKALGITGPAASKQVAALEEELGVKLLMRTTRMVNLTEDGAQYYERARLALEELKDAADQLQDTKTSPKGLLRINAPLSFGQMHLMPVLSGFAQKYPDLQMDVSLDDRMLDVIAEGFDVVIRVGVLSDSSLVARPLAPCPIYAVASPTYLATHGVPKHPGELKHHRIITYANQGAIGEWKYKDTQGKTGFVRLEGAFRSNNAEMMLTAALDGVGIAILPGFTVATRLAAGQLVHILEGFETFPQRQITALMPPNRYRSAKVKLFMDWLLAACRAMPLQLEPVK